MIVITTAIVVSAGESRRMGDINKLLLQYENSTIIERVIDTLTKTDVAQIVVVLGHQAELVQKVIENRNITICINNNYQAGMTTSIQLGIQNADPNTDGFMICLADMPLIEIDEYNHLLKIFQSQSDPKIVVPKYQNQRGNPVLFSRYFKDDILKTKIMNGCREVVKQNKAYITFTDMRTDHILIDVDSPQDYKNLVN